MAGISHITISHGAAELAADLSIPEGAGGIVVFAHGSGSSRKSPRNRQVAQALQNVGLATLLLDLLTVSEESRDALDASLRFDIDMLTERLTAVVDDVAERPGTSEIGRAHV